MLIYSFLGEEDKPTWIIDRFTTATPDLDDDDDDDVVSTGGYDDVTTVGFGKYNHRWCYLVTIIIFPPTTHTFLNIILYECIGSVCGK